MSQSHFQKFVPKKKNSLIKEEFKQAKKKAKRERAIAIDKRFEEKRRLKAAERNAPPANTAQRTAPVKRAEVKEPQPQKIEQPTFKQPVNDKPAFQQPQISKVTSKFDKTEKPERAGKPERNGKPERLPKPAKLTGTKAEQTQQKKVNKINAIEANFLQTEKILGIKKEYAAPAEKPAVKTLNGKPIPVIAKLMPLNKFLAHCGVCSRRDAVTIIKEGKVKVNDAVILEPAHKVSERDEVKFNGKKLFVSKNLVYILLNKPKDYITTTDDPQGRKTVLQLTKMATTERIYPVGRLDRNTSGVLLLTNDGELTQKLSHPSYNITKVYEVKLDKNLTKADFDKILNGLILEDGEVKADSLAYADAKDKSVIGIEIHSGRNRIVRRIFEHLGYDVKGLDRVMYATLTKKNVERGKWRFLAEKEVRLLKYLNASHKKILPAEKATKNLGDD